MNTNQHLILQLYRFVVLSCILLGVFLLTACQGEYKLDRAKAETYVRSHITTLSPVGPSFGGSFYVTKVEWVDDDTIRVFYEDGHSAYVGITNVEMYDNGELDIDIFDVSSTSPSSSSTLSSSSSTTSSSPSSTSSSPSSTSVSSSTSSARPRAGRGEFCGGIAGIMCEEGLTCDYEGAYPDAGGVCI